MAKKENLHQGHRQRMIKKYLEHGIDCFEEHEVLEILLFSCYTRRNTNDIAHALLKRFHNLDGVFNADYDELLEVENVGPNAAVMLRFFKDFTKRYNHDSYCGIVLDSTQRMCEHCHRLLKDYTVEAAYVLLLDGAYSLINEFQLSRGVTQRVDFDIKTIVTKAIKSQCSRVVLVHNHPHGVALASADDVVTTRRAANALSSIGLELVDHIIVCEDDAYSMRNGHLLPDIWYNCEV